jgi:hypothetical protein
LLDLLSPADRIAAQISRTQELLVLQQLERDAVQDSNCGLLDAVLAQKQIVIDAMSAANGELQPLQSNGAWAEGFAALTALLREAVQQHQANESMLGERLAHMRGRLRSLQQGQRTLAAYGSSLQGRQGARVPRFIDRQR